MVGLPPACVNAETHALCRFIGTCDRISRQEIISNIYKSCITRARTASSYQRPHSSFIVRAPTSWNAPTYRSKLSPFCLVFFPIFASPPYLIFVLGLIYAHICVYRQDLMLPTLTSPRESIWRYYSANPNAREVAPFSRCALLFSFLLHHHPTKRLGLTDKFLSHIEDLLISCRPDLHAEAATYDIVLDHRPSFSTVTHPLIATSSALTKTTQALAASRPLSSSSSSTPSSPPDTDTSPASAASFSSTSASSRTPAGGSTTSRPLPTTPPRPSLFPLPSLQTLPNHRRTLRAVSRHSRYPPASPPSPSPPSHTATRSAPTHTMRAPSSPASSAHSSSPSTGPSPAHARSSNYYVILVVHSDVRF